MKVCILKGSLDAKGGLEKYCSRISSSLSARGDEVQVLGFGKSQGAISTKYPISYCTLRGFDAACHRYLKAHSFDAVLGFFRNRCLQTHYRAGNGCHRAYLERRKASDSFWKSLSFRWNPLHRFILDCEKKTFESPDLRYLIVNSNLVRREIEHFYPHVDSKKIAVVHNGVEWHELQERFDDANDYCEELGVQKSSFKLLFIGHEWKRKGLELVLRAMTLLPKDIELLIVGHDRNEPEFRRMVEALGLQSQVYFFGRRSDTWKFYKVADVCVIPSTYDPFANVTVEALAMGCFVISSCENGGAEVLEEGRTGFVFRDLSNPEELRDVLAQSREFFKTRDRSKQIRESVQALDFSHQLQKIVQLI